MGNSQGNGKGKATGKATGRGKGKGKDKKRRDTGNRAKECQMTTTKAQAQRGWVCFACEAEQCGRQRRSASRGQGKVRDAQSEQKRKHARAKVYFNFDVVSDTERLAQTNGNKCALAVCQTSRYPVKVDQ